MAGALALILALQDKEQTYEEFIKSWVRIELTAKENWAMFSGDFDNQRFWSAGGNDRAGTSIQAVGPDWSMSIHKGGGSMGGMPKAGPVLSFTFTRNETRSILIQQIPKRRISIELYDEKQAIDGVFILSDVGVSLVLSGTRPVAHRWKTLEEAFRVNPIELGEFVRQLRSFSIAVGLTPADPEVVELAVRWHEPVERKEIDRLADQLSDESPQVRQQARDGLVKLVTENRSRLKVVAKLQAKAADPEVRDQLQTVLRSQNQWRTAMALVQSMELYRDLTYLSALLDAGNEHAKEALKAITGREFARRADVEAWVRDCSPKWNEQSGKYE
jgi:hypothetical protein